eukprot:s379_g21.t1
MDAKQIAALDTRALIILLLNIILNLAQRFGVSSSGVAVGPQSSHGDEEAVVSGVVGQTKVIAITGAGSTGGTDSFHMASLPNFRARWSNLASGRIRDLSPDPGDTHDPADAFLEDVNLFSDAVPPDSVGSFAESVELDVDFDKQSELQTPVQQHVNFMEPKPKAAPDRFSSRPQLSSEIKRTTDECASRIMQKQIVDMKQPWQKGPLAALFSRQRPFWEKPMTAGGLTSVGLSDHISASDTATAIPRIAQQTELTVQRIRSSRIISSDDDFRRLALSRFKTMVLLELDATRLGLSLLSFAGTLCTEDELSQIFTDVFSPKSSGTILKRCNALWRFTTWLQSKQLGSPFNQDEQVIYAYICHLRDSGAGSTTPSQFTEALRFADGLLGFCNRDVKSMLSSRVTGAAHATYMTKRIRKPAEILTVDEISELERLSIFDPEDHRRLIAGHLIFCFMAAARWHDSMYVVSLECSSEGPLTLVEATTERHKSSRGKEQQLELLPFTALGNVLKDESWAENWMAVRSQECESWQYFLCSWSEHRNCWADARMSTAEASCWLREMLEPVSGSERSSKLTVHGLKATMLSWAAKSLLFTPEEQLALGHHVSSQYRSALIYSRDTQIGLCQKIQTMLDRLRSGAFHPDGRRVERLFHLTLDRARELEEESSSSDSTDASSVASSDAEHAGHEPSSSFARLTADGLNRELCFINQKSKVIHLELLEESKFWCGRSITSSFRKVAREELSNPEAVICASCSHAFRASHSDE